jgi:hypothetical protein
MAKTTPIGTLVTIETLFFLKPEKLSAPIVSPSKCLPSSAVYLIKSTVLLISEIAELVSFAISNSSIQAIFSICSSRISAALCSTLALSFMGVSPHFFCSAFEFSIILSTSFLENACTLPTKVPSTGELIAMVSPLSL